MEGSRGLGGKLINLVRSGCTPHFSFCSIRVDGQRIAIRFDPLTPEQSKLAEVKALKNE